MAHHYGLQLLICSPVSTLKSMQVTHVNIGLLLDIYIRHDYPYRMVAKVAVVISGKLLWDLFAVSLTYFSPGSMSTGFYSILAHYL